MPLALIFKDNFIRLAEKKKTKILLVITYSNEILGWEGVGNRQLLYFFKA
jgi:hypothetical protein